MVRLVNEQSESEENYACYELIICALTLSQINEFQGKVTANSARTGKTIANNAYLENGTGGLHV